MRMTWVPGPTLCSACATPAPEGLPALWLRTWVFTVCPDCRGRLRQQLADFDRYGHVIERDTGTNGVPVRD